MAELNGNKIYEKLEAIEAKVDKLLLWKVEHVEAHKLLERDVADVRSSLFDNPGIIDRVNALWNYRTDVTRWRQFWLDVFRYVLVASIVGVATWLLIIYKQS